MDTVFKTLQTGSNLLMEPVPFTILSTLILIIYMFGVPRVANKLSLTFKSDSKILNKVLDGTKLR